MTSLKERLDSAKSPSAVSINWVPLQERGVLRLEGGTPFDLDARLQINQVLRSVHGASLQKTVIQDPVPAGLSYTGVKISFQEWDNTFQQAVNDQKVLSQRLVYHYQSHGIAPPDDVHGKLARLGVNPLPPPVDGISHLYGAVTFRQHPFNARRVTRWMQEPEKPEGNYIEPPAYLPDRHSKSIADIQKWTKFEEEKKEIRRKLVAAENVIFLMEKAGPEIADLEARKDSDTFQAPIYTEPKGTIEVCYRSTKELPSHVHAYLSKLYLQYRGELLWYAPQEAVKDGKVQPLTDAAASKLTGLLNKKEKKLQDLKNSDREVLAWRWLIISHNTVNPKAQVKLPQHLTLGYEGRKRKPQPQNVGEDLKKHFTNLISGLQQSVAESHGKKAESPQVGDQYLLKRDVDECFASIKRSLDLILLPFVKYDEAKEVYTMGSEPLKGATMRIKEGNQILDQMGILMEGKGKIAFSSSSESYQKLFENFNDELLDSFLKYVEGEDNSPPSPDTTPTSEKKTETVVSPPDVIEEGGHILVITTESELSGLPSDTQIEYRYGRLYRWMTDVQEESSSVRPPPDQQGKKKKKQKNSPVSTTKPKPAEEGKGKMKASSSTNSDTDSKPAKKDPIVEGKNPLHVKGLPRSSKLDDEQRASLRKFFKLDEIVRPEQKVWEKMTTKEKSKFSSSRALPRWAVDAVLRDPKNLESILDGSLTKENFGTKVRTDRGKPTEGQPKTGSVAEATAAWKKVKDKYPGVGLFARPQSNEEKALKKEFDSLVEKFGKLSCFPKLGKHPSSQKSKKTSGSVSPALGSQGMDQQFALILQLVNGLALATQGKLGVDAKK